MVASNFWGEHGKSTGNKGREGRKEGERDRKDREKNRLTSLHLIGSGCNHKKTHTQTIDDRKQSETRKKPQDSETQRDTETTMPQRLAVRDG